MSTDAFHILKLHLKEAVFSVGAGGIIVEPVTDHSIFVFGQSILGENVMQVLFKDLKSNPEVYDSVASTLNTIFGESELQWDLAESHLPRRIEYHSSTESADEIKLFKINITPIWNSDQNLEKLLFSVEDITHVERREEQIKQNHEVSGMLECILENNPQDLIKGVDFFKESLKTARGLVAQIDPSNFMELLRVLHTVKGSARQLRMKLFSEQIHKSESAVMSVMSDVFQSDDATPISAELNAIEENLNAHLGLIKKILRSDSNAYEGMIPVHPSSLESALKMVDSVRFEMQPQTFKKIKSSVQRISYKSVAQLSSKLSNMVEDIAGELNKKVSLTVVGDAFVSPEISGPLQQCLVHIIRNSIDHGIEAQEERTAAGKSIEGKIQILCAENSEDQIIQISDDGRGLNTDILVQNAVAKGLLSRDVVQNLSEQEKENLIFLPNLSTKESVSSISGRGIGMDFVKETILRLGGKVETTSVQGRGLSIKIIFNTSEAQPSENKAA